MDIITIKNPDIAEYIEFIKRLYRDDSHCRLSLLPTMKKIISGKSVFCKNKKIHPLLVKENGRTICVGTLIWTKTLPDYIQIAFFETENTPVGIRELIREAKKMGKLVGAKYILFGMDGHQSYGFGILSDSFDKPARFGNSYNYSYYIPLLEQNAEELLNLKTYKKNLKDLIDETPKAKLDLQLNQFTIRAVRFRQLEKEITHYTRISNICFANHPLYYPRTVEEDIELFKDFRPLLKPDNLLFLEKEGLPVGFILWYPDFNELIKPGKTIGLMTFLKYRVLSIPISTYRGVQIAVLPEFQRSGAGIALMNACFQRVGNDHLWAETGWITESNEKSKKLVNKWTTNTTETSRSFKIYRVAI